MKSAIQYAATACVAVLLFTNCQKEPSANIGTGKTRVHAGETVYFTNDSREGESFEWNFGDGTTSTEENPTKVFETPGNYTVRLTAFSKRKKKEDVDQEVITVTDRPFVGTHAVTGYWSTSDCKNGTLSYQSGNSTYNLVIKQGANENEIIIDNLANLGINGVKCKVTTSTFFMYDEASFNIVAGQTLTDKDGRTWTYATSGVSGTFDSMDNCRTIYVTLRRMVTCGTTTSEVSYTENSDHCN